MKMKAKRILACLLTLCLLSAVAVSVNAAEAPGDKDERQPYAYSCPVCGTRLKTGSFEVGAAYTQTVSHCNTFNYSHDHEAQDMFYGDKCDSCGYKDVEYTFTLSVCLEQMKKSKNRAASVPDAFASIADVDWKPVLEKLDPLHKTAQSPVK